MEQSPLIEFEQGMDQFMATIKACLTDVQQLQVRHCTMPQCLDSFIVTDDNNQVLILRLVLVGYTPDVALARLSWLDPRGQDHVCCYLNSQFESIQRKCNGKWVRHKHSPETMCLLQWSQLHCAPVQ